MKNFDFLDQKDKQRLFDVLKTLKLNLSEAQISEIWENYSASQFSGCSALSCSDLEIADIFYQSISPIQLIAKHLHADQIGIEPEDLSGKNLVCAFSGIPLERGYPLKKILSGNFSDVDCIKFSGGYMSVEMASLLKQCLPNPEGGYTELRKYSFIATPSEIVLLRADNLLEHLLNTNKETPFVFCVGSLQASKAQKHTSFKAQLNHSNDIFTVSTEVGQVTVEMSKINAVLPIVQAWYSVTEQSKGKATEMTYFTKDEIKQGCQNLQKIEQYGAEKYLTENAILEKVRGGLWFELLVKAIKKQ
jgi:hypothetical protein